MRSIGDRRWFVSVLILTLHARGGPWRCERSVAAWARTHAEIALMSRINPRRADNGRRGGVGERHRTAQLRGIDGDAGHTMFGHDAPSLREAGPGLPGQSS